MWKSNYWFLVICFKGLLKNVYDWGACNNRVLQCCHVSDFFRKQWNILNEDLIKQIRHHTRTFFIFSIQSLKTWLKNGLYSGNEETIKKIKTTSGLGAHLWEISLIAIWLVEEPIRTLVARGGHLKEVSLLAIWLKEGPIGFWLAGCSEEIHCTQKFKECASRFSWKIIQALSNFSLQPSDLSH